MRGFHTNLPGAPVAVLITSESDVDAAQGAGPRVFGRVFLINSRILRTVLAGVCIVHAGLPQ